MARGWTSEQETDGMRARWRMLTVEEIRNHKEVAAERVERAMQDLYLQTGIHFDVSARMFSQDELNAKTQWVARRSYVISLVGQI